MMLRRTGEGTLQKRAWLVILGLTIGLSGCGYGPYSSAGAEFDLPPGWDHLNDDELRQRGGATTVMVGTADRSALAFVARVEGVNLTGLLPDRYGPTVPKRTAMVGVALEEALPNRYSDFRLVRRGSVRLGGIPGAEIVFLGREPGEDRRWRRLVLVASEEDRIVMFGFGCPEGKDADFASDLSFIESSWRWED